MKSLLSRRRLIGHVAASALVLGTATACVGAEEAVRIPPPAQDPAPAVAGPQKVVFAGGCFWGVQGVFQRVNGVIQAVSGYAGGKKETAMYEMVGTGLTGHAESVKVTYDPKKVSYGTLLQIYFSVAHDPTQLNRQGPDSGTQYRSAVFPATPAQRTVAQAYIAQLDAAKLYGKPIVTTLEDKAAFFPAEAYHQDYLTENPHAPYIVFNDLPKVAALKRLFPERFRSDPVLVKASR